MISPLSGQWLVFRLLEAGPLLAMLCDLFLIVLTLLVPFCEYGDEKTASEHRA